MLINKTILVNITPSMMELVLAVKPSFIGAKPTIEFKHEVYELALKNGVPLSYLSTVIINNKDEDSLRYYYKHLNHYYRILETITVISKLLNTVDVPFVVTKTIRPYPEDTYDIDVLILGDKAMFKKAVKLFLHNRFKFKSYGPYNVDMVAPNNVDVDVYFDVSANRLVYISKRYLDHYIAYTNIEDVNVPILSYAAELLLLTLHGEVKEHINLGTILTGLYFVHMMNSRDIDDLMKLAEKTSSRKALSLFISMLYLFARLFYRYTEPNLERLIKELGVNNQALNLLLKTTPPYRVKAITLLGIFSGKLRDPVFRISLFDQVVSIIRMRAIERGRLVMRLLDIAGLYREL